MAKRASTLPGRLDVLIKTVIDQVYKQHLPLSFMVFLSTLPVPHAVSIACSSKQTITSSRSRQQGILAFHGSRRPRVLPRSRGARRSMSSRMTRRQPRVRLEHVQRGKESRDRVLVSARHRTSPRASTLATSDRLSLARSAQGLRMGSRVDELLERLGHPGTPDHDRFYCTLPLSRSSTSVISRSRCLEIIVRPYHYWFPKAQKDNCDKASFRRLREHQQRCRIRPRCQGCGRGLVQAYGRWR